MACSTIWKLISTSGRRVLPARRSARPVAEAPSRPAALPIVSLPIGERDVVRAAFAKAGYRIDVAYRPWKRAVDMAKKGTDDVIAYFPGYHCRHREGFVASEPIGNGPLGFAAREAAGEREGDQTEDQQPAAIDSNFDPSNSGDRPGRAAQHTSTCRSLHPRLERKIGAGLAWNVSGSISVHSQRRLAARREVSAERMHHDDVEIRTPRGRR